MVRVIISASSSGASRARSRWVLPMAIAAALLLGVAIDRFSLHRVADPRTTMPERSVATAPEPLTHAPASVTVAAPRSEAAARRVAAARTDIPGTSSRSESGRDPSRLYRLAAVQTLTQAEALLTAYRASGVAVRDPAAARQLGMWGREVLSSTRLLLDSPAGDDATLRPLLNDLELVLVQIIRLSGAPLDANDRALIDDAMRSRDLLPRIRTAVPAGAAGTASDE